jgi:hypothetical protein
VVGRYMPVLRIAGLLAGVRSVVAGQVAVKECPHSCGDDVVDLLLGEPRQAATCVPAAPRPGEPRYGDTILLNGYSPKRPNSASS